jgi:hypothetical protein
MSGGRYKRGTAWVAAQIMLLQLTRAPLHVPAAAAAAVASAAASVSLVATARACAKLFALATKNDQIVEATCLGSTRQVGLVTYSHTCAVVRRAQCCTGEDGVELRGGEEADAGAHRQLATAVERAVIVRGLISSFETSGWVTRLWCCSR